MAVGSLFPYSGVLGYSFSLSFVVNIFYMYMVLLPGFSILSGDLGRLKNYTVT